MDRDQRIISQKRLQISDKALFKFGSVMPFKADLVIMDEDNPLKIFHFQRTASCSRDRSKPYRRTHRHVRSR